MTQLRHQLTREGFHDHERALFGVSMRQQLEALMLGKRPPRPGRLRRSKVEGASVRTPKTERSLIEVRIRECEARLLSQRQKIAQMAAAGTDTSSALNLLSAMESGQALRVRRLAALG